MLIYINKKDELVIDGCDITIINVPNDLGSHKSIFEWFLSGIHVNKHVIVTGMNFIKKDTGEKYSKQTGKL